MHRAGQHALELAKRCARWPSSLFVRPVPRTLQGSGSRGSNAAVRDCIAIAPLLDLAARIVERDEDVLVEAFLAQAALKVSMNAFWIGLPGSMNCSRTPRRRPIHRAPDREFRAVVGLNHRRQAALLRRRSNTLVTRSPVSDTSTSIARLSRLHSSITARARNRRPLISPS